MKVKQVTENQLLEASARLKAVVAEDAQGVGQAVGQAVGGAAGLAAAVPRAGLEIGQAVANKAGDWWNQAKQGVSNFAQGAVQGAKQGWAATDPANLVGGQSAKPAKYPTTPQEIKAFQQANGLTPDGVIGPKTQAALAKAGLKPTAAPTPPKPTGATGTQSTKPAPAPAAAPQTQTQQNMAAAGMAGQEMRSPQELAANADLANSGLEEGITTFKTESDSLARIVELSRRK